MPSKHGTFISLLAALLTITPLKATLIRALNLVSLTTRADIIAIGEVTSVENRGATTLDLGGGPLQAKHFVAYLRMDQVLKGNIPPGAQILDFTVPQAPIGIHGVAPGQYGIFFLSEDQSLLRFTDPMYPSLPAPRKAKLPSATVLDQVTALLGQVLQSPEVSDTERVEALDALGRLETNLARDTLLQALSNPSENIRLDVARTLVARNDISGLGIVEEALVHPSKLSTIMISNLAGSLGGLKDWRAVPALKRLLDTNDQRIIKGVVIALRQSGSADALEPLARLLTNSDEQVRYYAVVGMGEITRQDEWTPAFDEFQKNEAKYLSYWRDWATSNLPQDTNK
jgi:HEAT repeat protein